ncbi:MAG: DegT/DnrJ/EryC1/StrS family aminotransferase [Acidobacteriota bacterium]
MTSFLPFSMPDIGEDEIAEVVDSLRSGWLTTGPKTQIFEKEFARFLRAREEAGVETESAAPLQALAVNSATAGLHLALEAMGVGPGDEVITSPYTFTATAGVIRHLGANPVFVDIDPVTLNIDHRKIERAITERTKVILPIHIGGLACEMEPILEIARRRGLRVVEDAAHALPSTYRGRLVGTLGSDATVYSFYATKTITTGEGGMIVTRDPEVANRCRVMRLHGINRDAFDRYSSTKPSWHYDVVAPGFKYNLTDLAAAIGIQQLKKAWAFQEKRARMARRYDDELRALPTILPAGAPEGELHSWHLYIMRLDHSIRITREEFIKQMARRGIGCSVHFIPLHLHPYWRETYNLQPHHFPTAWRAYERVVSLPLYTKMSEDDQTRVIEAVREVISLAANRPRNSLIFSTAASD